MASLSETALSPWSIDYSFFQYIPHFCPSVYLFILFSKTWRVPLPSGLFSKMIIGLMSILTKGEAECISRRNGVGRENVKEAGINNSLRFKSNVTKSLLLTLSTLWCSSYFSS